MEIESFQLLEFDTIARTKETGWGLLVIGTHAKVLEGLVEEFVKLLEEESEVQIKRTELEGELIKFLD